MATAERTVAAVDVGTGSARAALFDSSGHLLGRGEHPILLERPETDHAEHSSEDIWQAVCHAVHDARAQAGALPRSVAGISFDATCSLVALDTAGLPVSVSTTRDDRWNVVVWLDHRALAEAEEVTDTGHRVLAYVGGVMSPEMEVPKLMWLKRHMPGNWRRFGKVFDLADFLAWKASGTAVRSQCTLACKWTYLAHEQNGWQEDFLVTVGLDDMLERAGMPARANEIGAAAGHLTKAAAHDLGLTTNCTVAVGLIDAHAGALGVLGQALDDPQTLDRHIALIAGTSTCHMALAAEARKIPGVWGPYYGAVAPGLWLNEGGQSATGALLDHIIAWHPAGRSLGSDPHGEILARIDALRGDSPEDIAADLHVLGDFHGNRSPLADPQARGAIFGLGLDTSFDSLAQLYYATAAAVALGTRHILEALNERGYRIDTLDLTGGHGKNPLLVELYADATGCAVAVPEAKDGVLLGGAMVASVGAGVHPSLGAAAKAMARVGSSTVPRPDFQAPLDRRYKAMRLLQDQSLALRAL